MITQDQLFNLSRKFKINETAILREYIQLYFLSRLYELKESQTIYFKGGTAIHFLYQSPRFSEDLDFTVEINQKKFEIFINNFFKSLQTEEPVSFRGKKTITGKKYLLSYSPNLVNFLVFINLDFSFREKIIYKTKSVIRTDFPVIFKSYIYHPEKKELLAEKIRAFLTRGAGRDIYDLWYLLSQGVEVDKELVIEKLKYYQIDQFNLNDILKKLEKFSKKDFIRDLKPFVNFSEREKLGKFFDYIIDFFRVELKSNSSF